jgi:hypothetical protein
MAQDPPAECAQCGASIPRNAKACLECGADERTGWRETSIYDGLDLPGDDEAGRPGRKTVNGIAWYWWAAGVALALLLGLAMIGLR